MSVGVHTGLFDFFMVGGSHRELLVAGPAATETILAEKVAGAGQIFITAATAAELPKSAVGKSVETGFLLAGHISAPRVEIDVAQPNPGLTQFVPVALREPLLAGQVEPEHRPAVVAFLSFSNFDRLVLGDGPEAAAQALDRLVKTVQTAVDPRWVTFLASDVAGDGGKIILTSGVPQTTGFDAEQMLLAANEIAMTPLDLPVHIGVNWGPVFAGEVGPGYRRTYTVMGDTVNLAARLMAQAGPGEVLATRDVLGLSRTLFLVERREPFYVKGKQHPVTALEVGAPCGTRQAADAGIPLIGRDEELAVLEDFWRSAEVSAGRLVELVAEPGMGKSRLLQEFLLRIGDAPVVTAECRLYQAGTPFFPIKSLLGRVLGTDGLDPKAAEALLRQTVTEEAPELEPWLSLIGVVLDLELAESLEVSQLDDQFRLTRTASAIVSLTGALVRVPTLFVIEDAHWMDEASHEVLTGLLAELGERPWMFVLTRRPGDQRFLPEESAAGEVIELQPLSKEQAETLIAAATTARPLLPRQMATLAERAEGNPLFLIELLNALVQGGNVETLPHSVEGLISARIDRLPSIDRNLLRRVAVLGNEFDADHTGWVLPAVSPEARLKAFRRLSAFLNVSATGWVQFQHALIRDVAYEELPFKTRLELHANVGDSICATSEGQPEAHAAILSLHYYAARRWNDAWRFSLLAGDDAKEIYANLEAARFYERAAEAARFMPMIGHRARVEVLRSLGDVKERAGLFTEAVEAYRKAAQLTDDPVGLADLKYKRAVVRMRLGTFSQALREVAAGQRLLEGVDSVEASRVRARLLAHGAQVRMAQEQDRMAIEMAQRAITEAEAADEKQALAVAYAVLDTSYRWLGESDKAVYAPMARRLYEELGDLSGQATLTGNLGIAAFFEGRWNDAIRLYEESRDNHLRAGNEVQAAMWSANIAEVLINQGKMAAGEALLVEAVPTLAAAGLDSVAFAEVQMGRVLASRGEFTEAMAMIERALDHIREMGQSITAIDATVELAAALVSAGRPDEAIDHLGGTDSRSSAAEAFGARLHRVRARALSAMGRDDEAQLELLRGLEVADRRQDPYEKAMLTMALADLERRLGQPVDDETIEEARRTLADLGVELP
jgi:class 3 adenylate cyclase/tetratricopeptide (TPR) repeat protein